jgi:hypothetical protein
MKLSTMEYILIFIDYFLVVQWTDADFNTAFTIRTVAESG